MEFEDVLESVVWALPFLVIAAIFYGIAAWKKNKGQGFHAEAKQLLSQGNHKEARELLLQALWKANEIPQLERRILTDLGKLYEEINVAFDPGDYMVLIRQFEQLSTKKSHKAISEMKKVQAVKKGLIGGMPTLP